MLVNEQLSLNEKYLLLNGRIESLVSSLNQALMAFDEVVAVRLDFGVSNWGVQEVDVPRRSVFDCFDVFLNRIRRKRVNNQVVSFIANWKKEWSIDKGEHIHTVFYFDRKQFPAFTPTTTIFNDFRGLWEHCTSDSSLSAGGYINIVYSYLSESTEYYRTTPLQGIRDERYNKKHYYTVLVKDMSAEAFRRLEDYHKQRHYCQYRCGFTHWISYLAKTEQQAQLKKSFGSVSNVLPTYETCL